MYALVDGACWAWSVFMIVNGGLVSSGSNSLVGYSNSLFWITAGVLFFVFYPILLEICIYLHALTDTPVAPNLAGLVPIAYSTSYNITACGIEKLHPFDSEKYRKVFNTLLLPGRHIVPSKCPRSLLTPVHSFIFLLSLCYSLQVFRAVEIPVCLIPSFFLRWKVLNPMLCATYGSILSGCAAVVNKKYAINLSGGYHHASGNSCGGFCIYADITLTAYWVRKWYPHVVRKVMIVDLDAHQGNGHENDFLDDEDTFIIDFYNPGVYPNDEKAKRAIRYTEHIHWEDSDKEYLEKLDKALAISIRDFVPNFIIYNAGTDCMAGDPLGNLNITAGGIIKRDETVFRHAFMSNIPVLMVLSGGYQLENAPVIAESITNLIDKFKLFSY